MPEIDELNIKIKAEASQATTALDNLTNKLMNLGKVLESVGRYSESFNKIAEGLNNFAGSINNVDAEKLSSISSALRNISYASSTMGKAAQNLNFDGVATSARNADNEVEKLGRDIALSYGITSEDTINKISNAFTVCCGSLQSTTISFISLSNE